MNLSLLQVDIVASFLEISCFFDFSKLFKSFLYKKQVNISEIMLFINLIGRVVIKTCSVKRMFNKIHEINSERPVIEPALGRCRR